MQPSVSIIIPVRNESDAIRDAIDSAIHQSYPNIIEIIVADGMSTDETRRTVSEIADERIQIVDNPSTTTPAGLNVAIRSATGQVVVRCDAHSVLPTDYVEVAITIMDETGAVNVGGIQQATGTSPFQSATALAMSSRLGVGDAKFHFGGTAGPTDTVYLGVFDRAALLEAGLFDEELIRNQDYELNIRLRQAGGLVYFDPRLAVTYSPRASLPALSKQFFEYGAWKRIVHGRHPDSIRPRQLAPPLLIIGLLASGVLALTPWRQLALILPAVYLTALITVSVATLIRTRQSAALLMPAAMAAMHLSWGLGYMSGSTPGAPASVP